MTTTPKKLVVLGAGTAGTMVVNKLHRALPSEDWIITVVDRDDIHDYQPGYLFMAFGTNSPEQVRRHKRPFISKGVNVLIGRGRPRRPARRASCTSSTDATWPTTSWSSPPAPRPRPDQVPGTLGPQWHHEVGEFYTYEGALALRDRLAGFSGGRLVVHITEMPIKCPVAPLEFTFLADDFLTKRGLRDRTEIVYVTPLDGAFTKPVASEALGSMLEEKGVTVEPDFMIERIDQDRKVIVSYDEREVAYDQLVTIPLNMGADFVARSGLGDELNYVPVDKHTMQSTAHPEIWALGDAGNLPTSKAGSVAHFSVEVFVENFLEQAAGQADDALLRRARQLLRRVRARQGPAARLQLRDPAADRPLPLPEGRPDDAAGGVARQPPRQARVPARLLERPAARPPARAGRRDVDDRQEPRANRPSRRAEHHDHHDDRRPRRRRERGGLPHRSPPSGTSRSPPSSRS